jgi:hypothetical protein
MMVLGWIVAVYIALLLLLPLFLVFSLIMAAIERLRAVIRGEEP